MIKLHPPFRPATLEDAPAMAELVNMAGEGLPLNLWTQLAEPGESPWDVGRERARRESGGFSYRNTVVREEDGAVCACLIGYPIADEPDPTVYDDMPDISLPLQQLEDMACGTWYVNVLAAYPEYRGKGYGTEFLALAERIALETGRKGLSVIVADTNLGARRLYERCGYREHAKRPMIKEGWQGPATAWILLLKTL